MQRTFEALLHLQVEAPKEELRRKILNNWDSVAKPLDGMGKFEALTAQIGAILGTEQLCLNKKAIIIMCSDNGIVEEGISQCGQEVTTAVVEKMATKASSVGKMARRVTGTCARHQRDLTTAIKRARQVALLPYVAD